MLTTWDHAQCNTPVERQMRLFDEMMERLRIDPGAAARDGSGVGFAAASRRCLI